MSRPIANSAASEALGNLRRFAEETELCAKALEIDPRCAMAYSNWGAALGELGRYAEECEKCAKAVELDPHFAEAYSNWGVALA